MFLSNIEIVLIESCFADPEKIRIRANLSDDIAEVMPCLNTTITSALFNAKTSLLTFTKEFRVIALRPKDLTVAKAIDVDDARLVLDWLKDLINETWANRETITPNYEMKDRPSATQVFMLFPKTNCGGCGESNCYAFVVKMLGGLQQLNNCKPLGMSKHAEARQTLFDLISPNKDDVNSCI